MRVVWTRPALNDVDQIQDFVAQDNPSAAFELATTLLGRTGDLLSANPLIGRGGRVPDTRELVFHGLPYIVVYRLRGDRIEVLAVVHGKRLWPQQFF